MSKRTSSHSRGTMGPGGGVAAPSPGPTLSEPEPEPATDGKPAPLRRFQVDAILRDAKLAGHDNPSALALMLEGPHPKLEEVRRQIAEARAKRVVKHWVQGPGSLRLGGQTHERGAVVMLTRAEAKDIGPAVAEHEPPPPTPEQGERPGGVYRIEGPGSVKLLGQFYGPGSEVELDAETARDLPVALTLIRAA